jgi:hypothetical protein
MLAKTKIEKNQKTLKKLREGVNISLKRQVRPKKTNISHLINQALVILYEVIFVVKILEKWDIFNFADFHRILHIS